VSQTKDTCVIQALKTPTISPVMGLGSDPRRNKISVAILCFSVTASFIGLSVYPVHAHGPQRWLRSIYRARRHCTASLDNMTFDSISANCLLFLWKHINSKTTVGFVQRKKGQTRLYKKNIPLRIRSTVHERK